MTDTVYGKKDIADLIKLRSLKWGDYPGLPRRVQWSHEGCKNGQSEKGDVIMEAETRVMLFEDVGKFHEI